MSKRKAAFWTEEELERARVEGERISAYLRENARKCLVGCRCGICGGDPAKQEPTDGAEPASPKVRHP